MPSTREEYEKWLINYFKANVDLNLFKMQLLLENPNTLNKPKSIFSKLTEK